MSELGCLHDGKFQNLEVAGSIDFGATDDLTLSSSTAEKPVLTLENTAADAESSIFVLKNTRNNATSMTDGDDLGTIRFTGRDNTTDTVFVSVLATAEARSTAEVEDGKLTIQVIKNTSATQVLSLNCDYGIFGSFATPLPIFARIMKERFILNFGTGGEQLDSNEDNYVSNVLTPVNVFPVLVEYLASLIDDDDPTTLQTLPLPW